MDGKGCNSGGSGRIGGGNDGKCSNADGNNVKGSNGNIVKGSKADGNTGGCSGIGGGTGGGTEIMKAPGGDGHYISRDAFENNPKGYFSDLHAKQKGK